MLSTSDKVIAYRHKTNMTQEQVAEYLDVSVVTYRKRESDPKKWRLSEVRKLAALFEVQLSDLIGDDNGTMQ